MGIIQRSHSRRQAARLIWLTVPALLAIAGCAGTAPPPKDTGPLAEYPASPAFLSIKSMHAEAGTDRDQRALLMTWFVDGDPNVAQYCSVLPDGHVSAYRIFYDVAVQNGLKRDLNSEELSELKQTMDSLPPSQSPVLRDLLIVSYRDYATGQWATRTYDRTARPSAVSALFTVTGAPIEPADNPVP
jgi:hypothetical protein